MARKKKKDDGKKAGEREDFPVARVTRADYARSRKLSRPYITKQVSKGKIQIGPDGLLDPDAADAALGIAWANGEPVKQKSKDRGGEGKGNLLSEETRLKAAQASLKELELEEARGRLVDVEEVANEWEKLVIAARQKWLGLGKKLAPRLIRQRRATQVAKIIDEEIHDILEDFANNYDPEQGRVVEPKKRNSSKKKSTAKTTKR